MNLLLLVGDVIGVQLCSGLDLPATARQSARTAEAAATEAAETTPAAGWQKQLHEDVLAALQRNNNGVWQHFIDETEKQLLHAALSYCHNCKTKAAETLSIGRNTITRKIQQLNRRKPHRQRFSDN